jgi:hypothetical protein
MDFDLVLYIVLIAGSILWSVLQTLKKDKTVKKTMKGATVQKGPVMVETSEEPAEGKSVRKKKKVVETKSPEDEYFTYETMSERDFQQDFDQNVEEHVSGSVTPESALQLDMDEDEVFKGVVWSEILKRKY